MVGRSLVAKIYLYAAAVSMLTLPLAFMATRTVRDAGRMEGMRSFLAPQLTFIERELEREAIDGEPTPERLDELGAALRHQIRFVPWSQAGDYPDALRTANHLIDERPPNRDRPPRHWLRIDRDGKPIGAVALQPARPPFGRPPGPFDPVPAMIWVVVLVLVIVPPLWVWVIRPLKAMAAATRRLASGDLQTPFVSRRQDEFGELERAFDQMRIELRRVIEQKERLLTDVSHEIRGPLARMTLALPLLHQEGASGPITEIFERELKAADTLLSEVLALARGQRSAALVMAPADLATIAAAALKDRAIAIEHKAQRIVPELQPAPVLGDERLIARAIGNLLDNALKYTPNGGLIQVWSGQEAGWSVLRIVDDGIGIAPAHLPQIFEPFYRPDDSRSRETGGTGLGLAIVRTIVQSHGGSIGLSSTKGKGTMVELRLPLQVTPPGS